jgi:ABC-type transport system substrate-binding protein
LNDGVEFTVMQEGQPRWLSFLRGDQDLLEEVPGEAIDLAAPGGRLAPWLARRGVQMLRYLRADVTLTYFAMEHPLVGGYTPQKVALRRAIALAMDVDTELRLVRGGQGVRAQSVVGPHTWGYDPAFFSEMGDFDLPRARALLDLFGYVDRDGDGWRELPDGAPLMLVLAAQPGLQNRQLAQLWQRNLGALGLRVRFDFATFQENLKASRAGRLMMWTLAISATTPDATGFLERGYGPNAGQANHARFRLPAYDALHRQQRSLPDGPQRAALLRQQQRLLVAYMPYKAHLHRVYTDLAQPWVRGYHRNVFVRDHWKYLELDPGERGRLLNDH